MRVAIIVVAFVAIWFIVALGVGLLISRMIAERDRHEH